VAGRPPLNVDTYQLSFWSLLIPFNIEIELFHFIHMEISTISLVKWIVIRFNALMTYYLWYGYGISIGPALRCFIRCLRFPSFATFALDWESLSFVPSSIMFSIDSISFDVTTSTTFYQFSFNQLILFCSHTIDSFATTLSFHFISFHFIHFSFPLPLPFPPKICSIHWLLCCRCHYDCDDCVASSWLTPFITF